MIKLLSSKYKTFIVDRKKISYSQVPITFCEALSPSAQAYICNDVRKCFTSNFPTLGDVDLAYYKGASSAWICFQLENIGEFSGASRKMESEQYKMLAQIISSKYCHLKVSEFMLFCYNFKAGFYREKKFYGCVDPMIITSALNEFMSYRSSMLAKIESEENQKRLEESNKTTMTYEEYKKRISKQ